jgi:hypothetical protein
MFPEVFPELYRQLRHRPNSLALLNTCDNAQDIADLRSHSCLRARLPRGHSKRNVPREGLLCVSRFGNPLCRPSPAVRVRNHVVRRGAKGVQRQDFSLGRAQSIGTWTPHATSLTGTLTMMPPETFSPSTFSTPFPQWCPSLALECGYFSAHTSVTWRKTWIARVRAPIVFYFLFPLGSFSNF